MDCNTPISGKSLKEHARLMVVRVSKFEYNPRKYRVFISKQLLQINQKNNSMELDI